MAIAFWGFRPIPGKEHTFLLAIWYAKVLESTIVWCANSNKHSPAAAVRNSKVELTGIGRLVLTDPETTSYGVPEALLMIQGTTTGQRLVLMEFLRSILIRRTRVAAEAGPSCGLRRMIFPGDLSTIRLHLELDLVDIIAYNSIRLDGWQSCLLDCSCAVAILQDPSLSPDLTDKPLIEQLYLRYQSQMALGKAPTLHSPVTKIRINLFDPFSLIRHLCNLQLHVVRRDFVDMILLVPKKTSRCG
ncbi:hypothetical protein F3Y22_tig00110458pilonHSYRG00418 [Hibiscus syriacus]|uniref:Uncharacterized protein n=1 Tax=Hibiscus syriacus TaxID=106335 RepID=A0A6A3AN70_HIBSY|nr:hypothetical protein F3Y22_tig00110458pilonHSYRG00418 [Hibiscus syriacus]